MQYYDLKRNWRRVRPHLSDPKVSDTLVRDFNKFTCGRWQQEFLPGMVPHQFEVLRLVIGHRGRQPAFWQYTKHVGLSLAGELQPRTSDGERAGSRVAHHHQPRAFDGVGRQFAAVRF